MTVSAVTAGQSAANVAVVGKLKLVNPPATDLAKGGDGLFRTKGGNPADAADDVRVSAGMLEASNVNAVTEISDLITEQRAYEMNSKVITTTDQMLQTVSQLR